MVKTTHENGTAWPFDCALRKSRSPLLATRLVADRSANVLGLAAAVLPPLVLLVGGAVDMGRAYLTQTSLQSACDAGVLAGRRAQAKSGQWGSAEIAKANKMFSYNFLLTGTSSTGTSFTPTNAGSGVISGTATTIMPTSVMKMFGKGDFTLTANCSAEFQISNIDVMFVLDVTGSMKCRPDGSNCNSGSDSKIHAMKESVRQFYYTMADAVPTGGTARLRFGFVPYAGTINLRKLVADGDIPQTYLTSTSPYSSKWANFDTPNMVNSVASVNVTSTQPNSTACTAWGNAAATATGGPDPADSTSTTYTRVSYSGTTCTRKETTTSRTQVGWKLNPTTPFTYKRGNIDTSVLKTLASDKIVTSINAAATVPLSGSFNMENLAEQTGATGITATDTTWAGCIEERNTVNTLFSNNSAPTGAYDHDLVSAPTSDATRWRPYVGRLVFDRNTSSTLNTTTNYSPESELCVPEARKFTTVDTSNPSSLPGWLSSYIDTLVANGNTYHDIGMVWGARLANPLGIMATNVNDGNLTSISRHIIMLTDGEMAPNNDIYNSYGLESTDSRVGPSGSSNATLTTYHNARFLTACATAKAMGYTVWFIGFGQTLTTEMKSCASSGRAYYASNAAALDETFRHIASQVADLRLKS